MVLSLGTFVIFRPLGGFRCEFANPGIRCGHQTWRIGWPCHAIRRLHPAPDTNQLSHTLIDMWAIRVVENCGFEFVNDDLHVWGNADFWGAPLCLVLAL